MKILKKSALIKIIGGGTMKGHFENMIKCVHSFFKNC